MLYADTAFDTTVAALDTTVAASVSAGLAPVVVPVQAWLLWLILGLWGALRSYGASVAALSSYWAYMGALDSYWAYWVL